jgi:hypothetical protein
MPPPDDPADKSSNPTLPMRRTDGPIGSLDFEVAPEVHGDFGDFELLEEIGSGGMGRVFKAKQKSQGRIVALKTILPRDAASTDAMARLRKEAEAAAQLDHPGIVPVYEFGECNGQWYFTMPLIDGQGLDERLRRGPLDNRMAASIVQKVADAVAHAHEKGVVHRDLKPANVLLDRDGGVKVTDFGIARRLKIEEGEEPEPEVRSSHPDVIGTVMRLTRDGAVVGTPGYMAPEQAFSKGRIGPPADIWALGALLYACLTGRPPFRGATAIEVLALTVDSKPVPPNLLNPDADPDLIGICWKCLRKEPQSRYRSARELALELQRWREGRAARSPWAQWRERAARHFASAPELIPLLAGLIVHRLANIQEGLLVGVALAGIGLAAPRRGIGPAILALAVCVLFFLSFAAGGWVAETSPGAAGGVVGIAGLAAIFVTLACGTVQMPPRPGRWDLVRVAGVCIPIAMLGVVLTTSLALGAARIWPISPVRTDSILALSRHLGQVTSWFLAVPLGLAVGGLMAKVSQWLDRPGHGSFPAFMLGAALAAVLVAWALREYRPDGLTETSRLTFLGPGAALSFAEDRAMRWLAGPWGAASAEMRLAATAGIFFLKLLLFAAPMFVAGSAVGLVLRLVGNRPSS